MISINLFYYWKNVLPLEIYERLQRKNTHTHKKTPSKNNNNENLLLEKEDFYIEDITAAD